MAEKRTKRGRPVKPEGTARTLALPSIRVSPDEMSFIETQAANAGLSVSAYVRNLATNRKVAPRTTDVEDKLLVALNRAASNHYQVVRALNFGQGVPSDIADIMDELRAVVAKVGAAYDA